MHPHPLVHVRKHTGLRGTCLHTQRTRENLVRFRFFRGTVLVVLPIVFLALLLLFPFLR